MLPNQSKPRGFFNNYPLKTSDFFFLGGGGEVVHTNLFGEPNLTIDFAANLQSGSSLTFVQFQRFLRQSFGLHFQSLARAQLKKLPQFLAR